MQRESSKESRCKFQEQDTKVLPLPQDVCEDRCLVCMSGGTGNSRKCNVTYEILCTRQGCKYIYQGETCRNALVRGCEHLRGMEKREEESVFVQCTWNHRSNDFSEEPCQQFKMCVTESQKTTLGRLMMEAVKIIKETK